MSAALQALKKLVADIESIGTNTHLIAYQEAKRVIEEAERAQARANAALAAAAPDLLAQLERATTWIQEFANGAVKPSENGIKLLADCHTTLAKARGES